MLQVLHCTKYTTLVELQFIGAPRIQHSFLLLSKNLSITLILLHAPQRFLSQPRLLPTLAAKEGNLSQTRRSLRLLPLTSILLWGVMERCLDFPGSEL